MQSDGKTFFREVFFARIIRGNDSEIEIIDINYRNYKYKYIEYADRETLIVFSLFYFQKNLL